ncbi:uncharacterized protein [Epargyreus clarus]|uniref:uncharacterized protein n=1 Tax=Epargyreus clarus TaxID=520877 RepID=UPI003C2C3B80
MPSRWIVSLKIQSRLDPNFVLPVSAYVLRRLTSLLPERKIIQVLPSSFASLELADPSFNTPGKIDLLLSTRVVGEILQEGLVKGSPGTPIAQKTKLGWILSGEVSKTMTVPVCCSVVARTNVDELLRKFWELESDESSTRHQVILTEEEQRCEDFYSSSTIRDATGRYIVKLPFKSEEPQSQYSRSEEIARKRFHILEKKFMKNPELGMQYKSVIQEYLQLGHAEIVPQSEIEKIAVYLPHHAVVREDKSTTKVRVVFDASCSGCNGVSLNDDLMVGPTLQPDLRHTIMRWRCHPICLVADIVKMYRQIKVSDEHVDYQRILWRESPDTELLHLRLLRVTFGTSSAPYLAVRTLQQVAYDEGKDFPLVSERVLKDFYVDDFLSGCESVAEGEQIYHQMNEMLGRGGFQLQKWSSNSNDLLTKLQSSESKDDETLHFEINASLKILGLKWNRSLDEFQYAVHLPPLETPSKENPADCASRGVNPCDLDKLDLWVSGPSWLRNEVIEYKKSSLLDTNLEERKSNVLVNFVKEQGEKDDFISRFSTLQRLTRIGWQPMVPAGTSFHLTLRISEGSGRLELSPQNIIFDASLAPAL